jgi:large subunit ribosomal protein L13
MRTPSVRKEDIDRPEVPELQRRWFVVDASELPLGRTATQVAMILRGKHRPTFTPHVDTGDFVIIVNAEKVPLTGRKLEQKMYYRHSTWPGGFKVRNAQQMLSSKPTELFRLAVKGMLPKGRLGRQMIKKLKVYAGPEHPHQAQKPTKLSFQRGEKP